MSAVDLIKDTLKQKGIGQAELARQLSVALGRNVDRSIVNKMLLGTRRIEAQELLALERVLGISFRHPEQKGRSVGRIRGVQEPQDDTVAVISSVDDDLKRGKRDIIFEADVRSGAGGGGVRSEEQVTFDHNGNTYAAEGVAGEWSLPRPVVTGLLRAAPKDILVFEVIGDSMEPRLKQGDRVFVDKRMTFPNPEGIFVLWDGYSVVVKQLQIVHKSDPLKLRVLSLNPQYEPYEVLADEVNIIGRYAGRFTTD
jgi:transcriptional regulator with XRE-family HTH domain